ncbi:MAG: hypothetical protein PHP14_01395 [Candidatus Pacebacteria bacterium]|nr:hypothetical protein [Candidatus Paceibacterota bacterium]MDD3808641.1 hypothetical protein [Candidatus Paceibacterota bacterium]
MISTVNKDIYSFDPNEVISVLKNFDDILGLKILNHKKPRIPIKIRFLAWKRYILKNQKKFKESDKIRDNILDLGYQINDYQTFYTISKKQ